MNMKSPFHVHASSCGSNSDGRSSKENDDNAVELQWAAIERLPTCKRLKTWLFDHKQNEGKNLKRRREREWWMLPSLNH